MAGGPEVEEDGGGDVAGAPAVRFSARRKRWSRRISWVLRVAVRSTVATANGVGDDELRSGACREESRGENGVQGKRGEVQGARGSAWREGEARERLGGSRRWPRRHRRSPPSCFGARGGRRQGGGGGLGLTGGLHRGGWASTGERQVSGLLSLFSLF